MNNAVFGKTMDNVRKYRDIKLVTIEGRRNCLVSELVSYNNFFFFFFFFENLLAMEIYSHIAKDVENRFYTSNYELNKPLPKGKNKKLISLVKYKLGGKIMKELVALKAKRYSYLTDNNDDDKKAKTQKSVS